MLDRFTVGDENPANGALKHHKALYLKGLLFSLEIAFIRTYGDCDWLRPLLRVG